MKLSLGQKLALSKRPNYLTLFYDQSFVKAYNESAYQFSKLVGKELKPKVYKMRHHPFQLVVMVSLPYHRLQQYTTALKQTKFGYELLGEFDFLGYETWFMQHHVYCDTSQ